VICHCANALAVGLAVAAGLLAIAVFVWLSRP
jgi:hypothetical protein